MTVAPSCELIICAPLRGDAASLQRLFTQGYHTRYLATLDEVAMALGDETGIIVFTEEALRQDLRSLAHALERQPTWSDIPLVLLASDSKRSGRGNDLLRRQLPAAATNLVILERPLSGASLLSSVAAAWRSRLRQFEMRDRLAELAQERERMQTLLENLPVGVCFMDTEGRTLVSNPFYEQHVSGHRIPSRQPEEASRWVALDAAGQLLSPDQFPGAKALRGERVKGQDFYHTSASGEESWLRVSAVPLHDETQRIIGATTVIADISDEKRAELALRRFNEELESQVAERTRTLALTLSELQRESAERSRAEEHLRQSLKMEAVGQLTGGIAHDFNNMLTGVLGALDLMKIKGKGQLEGLERYMEAAQHSAHRAAALTQRLLAFSRRQSLESRPMSANDLILALQELLERTVSEQISVTLALADDLPWVLADANQLENALLNLVINARDAMPDGGVITLATYLVSITEQGSEDEALAPGDYVCIEVRDTGTGIPERLLGKVLEPFFTTKPQGQGTGLGLSMVYGFARQSNGRLTLASDETGTQVCIYLPTAVQRGEPQQPVPVVFTQGDGETILLVEDDDAVRLVNQEALEALGYRVWSAAEGKAALRLLEQIPELNLLVTDVGLPGLNGRQLAEVIQQRRPRLPVLFLTGYAEGALSRTAFLGGNMELMTKPFTLDQLAAQVAAMLSQAAQRVTTTS
ncbi:hybrid sensor histidine kinase/response regulator [Pseudomonas sp. EpS/L25]|uniref:hybrid sensor histidine kinase/response regulator n=1 Tax=Pseudomonas sp. EpS/L25 TaxID=1749078 RepID=UPI0007439D24|nr:ATP-binding protein [Pseudomonas sp. EpS/L25]KUM43443.1 hybrid sensor histidine kinase/response regulator [Pseudomonas sp. EpS/L25]